MPGIPTIDTRASLELLFDEVIYTLVRLKAEPLPEVQALIPAFDALEQNWWTIHREEKTLQLALATSEAQIDRIDAVLDVISDGVAAMVKLEAKNNRSAAGLARYFGTARPSDFKRPVLGNQLERMRSWPAALQASTNSTLQALGTQLAEKLTTADTAVAGDRVAEQQLTDFRIAGNRRAFVDRLNGMRKSTHGELGKIAHAKGLASDFSDTFFRHDTATGEPGVDEIDRKLVALDAETARLKAHRTVVAAADEAEARVRDEAARAGKQASLDAAKRVVEEAAAKVAELEAELKK